MRDEIGRSEGASVADVVDPTSRRRNEAERSFSPHPSGTPRFFTPDASGAPRMRKSARRREPHEFFNGLLRRRSAPESVLFLDVITLLSRDSRKDALGWSAACRSTDWN